MEIKVEIAGGPALVELAEIAARPENVVRVRPDLPPFENSNPVAIECEITHPVVGKFHQRIGLVYLVADLGGGLCRVASLGLLSGQDGMSIDERVADGRLRSRGMPAPSAVEGICLVLGYTGGLEEWKILFSSPNEERPRVVVIQEISPTLVGEA